MKLALSYLRRESCVGIGRNLTYIRNTIGWSSFRRFSSFGSGISGNPISWTSVAVTGCLLGGVYIYYKSELDKARSEELGAVKSVGTPAIGGKWELFDKSGDLVTNSTYSGKYTILYFGFTYCPDICPNEIKKIGIVMERLRAKGHADEVVPIFISLDPDRDSLAQLRHYSQDFDPSIQWLTGTPDQLKKISKLFRVYYSKTDVANEDDTDYLVDHSIVLYFMDPSGVLIDYYSNAMTCDEIVSKIIKSI